MSRVLKNFTRVYSTTPKIIYRIPNVYDDTPNLRGNISQSSIELERVRRFGIKVSNPEFEKLFIFNDEDKEGKKTNSVVKMLLESTKELDGTIKHNQGEMITLLGALSVTQLNEIKTIFIQTFTLKGKQISAVDYDIDNNPANCLILGKRGSAWQKTMNFTMLSKDVFKLDFHYYMGDITTYYLSDTKIIEGFRKGNIFKDSKGFRLGCNLWDEMRMELLSIPPFSIPTFANYMGSLNKTEADLSGHSSIKFSNCNIVFIYNNEGKETSIDLLLFD